MNPIRTRLFAFATAADAGAAKAPTVAADAFTKDRLDTLDAFEASEEAFFPAIIRFLQIERKSKN
jgi:L-aminopeptidase/D-esterase-like protein